MRRPVIRHKSVDRGGGTRLSKNGEGEAYHMWVQINLLFPKSAPRVEEGRTSCFHWPKKGEVCSVLPFKKRARSRGALGLGPVSMPSKEVGL